MSNHLASISQYENQDRMLRVNEVVVLTGLSKTTLWRLERKGDFPARRQLSPGAVGWFRISVLKWLEDRQVLSTTNIQQVIPQSRRGRKKICRENNQVERKIYTEPLQEAPRRLGRFRR